MAVLFKEERMLTTGDGVNQANFLFDQFSHGITSYAKSMKDLLSKHSKYKKSTFLFGMRYFYKTKNL